MKGLVEPGTGINCKACVYGSTCNTGRGHAYHVKSCVQYTEGKPKTNADRIRSMSDEELAKLIEYCGCCPPLACPHNEVGVYVTPQDCEMCWLDWLKSPVVVSE